MNLEQHLAVVVTNDKDQDKEYGIEVTCPSLGDGVLPVIFKPMFPPGYIKIPDVGQTVKIFVIGEEEEDGIEHNGAIDYPDFAYYDHRIIDTQDGKLLSDFKKNYPKRCGMWNKDGSLFYFDETKNQKEFIVKLTDGKNFLQITESKITIDQNGTKIELENGTMITTVDTTKMGTSSAAEALPLWTTFSSALNTFFDSWTANLSPLSGAIDPLVQTYATNMKTAIVIIKTASTNSKSTKHFVDQ